jgi:hypothetical protein
MGGTVGHAYLIPLGQELGTLGLVAPLTRRHEVVFRFMPAPGERPDVIHSRCGLITVDARPRGGYGDIDLPWKRPGHLGGNPERATPVVRGIRAARASAAFKIERTSEGLAAGDALPFFVPARRAFKLVAAKGIAAGYALPRGYLT